MTDSLGWRKSSYSAGNGQCVEVAQSGGAILIRESDAPAVVVRTSPEKWWAFLEGAKRGEFDLPSD